MGQRLVINIQADGELLANSYYHWGGYTSSSLNIANSIFESGLLVDDFIKAIASPTQYAIKLLESTGAGYNSRNEGLIEYTQEGMQNTKSWAEASITLDLVTQIVIMDITWIDEDIEHLREDYNKYVAYYFPFDLTKCTFEDFPKLVHAYLNISSDRIQCPDGTIHRPIE